MTLAVEALAVRRGYGRTLVLKGVDLQVETGRILGLAGANGSGKTTLLSMLATLLRPQSGRLSIFGQALPAAREGVRRRIGVVGHASYLYPQLTVQENMAFYAALYQVPDGPTRIAALLSHFSLESKRGVPVGVLSRGLLQRAAMVRALLHGPDLLLLDEPFTALDATSVESLTEFLLSWRREGRTAVLTSHDLRRDGPLVDEIITLRDGRVAERMPGGTTTW